MDSDIDNNKSNTDRFIFPKWSNTLHFYIAIGLVIKLSFIIFVFWYWFSPKHLEVGYQPKQPIPYSHKFHVGELGLDCRYCHHSVETQAHANIPSSETCMNCHTMIKTDSPHIKKIKESYETGEPIEWVNVHMLPDYAYFDHSRHVNSGDSCVSCHGRVDQMKEVRQVEPLSMGWCLDCHRSPENHLRPTEFVTQLDWESDDQEKMGQFLKEAHGINPKEHCSTCHR